MSTRKRSHFSNPDHIRKSDLPPPRRGKALATDKVSPPLSRVSFNTFIYILSAFAFLVTVFQAWRIYQLKVAAGGWWNLALWRHLHAPPQDPPSAYTGHGAAGARARMEAEARVTNSVEDRINALAQALGVPSRDLASAIADAVRSHLPPASLSSVSAAEATQSGSAASILTGDDQAQQSWTRMAADDVPIDVD